MKTLLHYLKLVAIVVGAGTLSGLFVMLIALRDKGEVEVPYIEREEIVTALEKISSVGLNLKMTELAYHDHLPRNYVISQNPEAGKGLKPGRDVRVVVSKGVRDFVMPDVREMSLRQAKNILSQRGMKISQVEEAHSDVKEGYVIVQSPPRGRRIDKEARVELFVSIGPWPEKFILPDFRGDAAGDAASEIQMAGLKLGKLRYSSEGDGLPDTVVAQEPTAGKPVEKDEEISLVIKKEKSSASKKGRTYTVYNYTVPSNASGTVRVKAENVDGEKDIYLRSHKGGQTISILVEVAGKTTVRIFLGDELMEVKDFQ
ncbi:MAG: PASTA domain-containing protein [Nitrospinota bacterium]|nr:PASTA domain-containing protein [Nitrospinota bacterium]